MVTNGIWQPTDKNDLLEGTKAITPTQACKKKSKGTFHGILNANGFEQTAGKYFDPASTAALVTNDTAIKLCWYLFYWQIEQQGYMM